MKGEGSREKKNVATTIGSVESTNIILLAPN